MDGLVSNRHDVDVRDQDILSLYLYGLSRKKIALSKQMTYQAVVKVIQKVLRKNKPSR